MNVFGLDEKLPQLPKETSKLDDGKLGVVIESFKIIMDCFKIVCQPCTIHFHLHVPLIYCCR